MKKGIIGEFVLIILSATCLYSQPNWPEIKSNANFNVADSTYSLPYFQPNHVLGWEDGLYISRDGKNLFSTYIPIDLFSWYSDFVLHPACFNFDPYFRPPLLNIDTVTNSYGCPNFIQSDIIISQRANKSQSFPTWQSSNLRRSFSQEGAAVGVQLNADTFDVFVYARDNGNDTLHTDLWFMRNVPINPFQTTAVPILSTSAEENNPHIERLNDTTLLLFFDRDKYIYYSLSHNNGRNWSTPVKITTTLNDQGPYDVQPHLFNDNGEWWVYFCANNASGNRGIYKAKQTIPSNWDSWGPKQLVIEGTTISGGYGAIYGVGEPSLTQWGDLSFVVIYGDVNQSDTTNVFDSDPWFLPKKGSPLAFSSHSLTINKGLSVYPVPSGNSITIDFPDGYNNYQVVICTIWGEVVRSFNSVGSITLDISGLGSGIYSIGSNNIRPLSTRFIKE